jgi:hypothetical protein
MKTADNVTELDYYDGIINYYKETECKSEDDGIVETWSDRTYISLMKDLNSKKCLKDADISDVAKNSIILILNLFDKKCQVRSSTKLNEMSEEDKKIIKEALMNALD